MKKSDSTAYQAMVVTANGGNYAHSQLQDPVGVALKLLGSAFDQGGGGEGRRERGECIWMRRKLMYSSSYCLE